MVSQIAVLLWVSAGTSSVALGSNAWCQVGVARSVVFVLVDGVFFANAFCHLKGFVMGAVAEMPLPFVFTDSAANKVKDLIAEEGNPDLKLRVFVTGGGCSGFQYGFTFDEVANEDDTALEKNGVVLLVDPMSYQYLVGAEIDYTEGLEGAQFVIKNPNATSTCGCGSSFSA